MKRSLGTLPSYLLLSYFLEPYAHTVTNFKAVKWAIFLGYLLK